MKDHVIILQENEHLELSTEYNLSVDQVIRVIIPRGAIFIHHVTSTGNANIHVDYTIELHGEGASAHLIGRLHLQNIGKQTWLIQQHHYSPNTTSLVDIKAVLADESTMHYEGTITIEEQAIRSSAHQEQKNLIVGSGAKVTSIPNLQVLTNLVECGHGSAVSYLNEDHLFYLLARGIDFKNAQKIIITAFLKLL